MKFNEHLKLHGNINRIQELKNEGFGDNTISGFFKDNGIDIDANEIQAFCVAIDKLSKIAVTKKATKNLIDGQRILSSMIPNQ